MQSRMTLGLYVKSLLICLSGTAAFALGAGDAVRVTANLKVRTGPGTNFAVITDPGYPGVAPAGTLGEVIAGPQNATGYTWWKVDFGPGSYCGWSVQDGLQALAAVQSVTLALYVHEGSARGPLIPGARVSGQDGTGKGFDQTTGADGYVTLVGTPGTWWLAASRSGYETNSWSQDILSTGPKHAFLQATSKAVPTPAVSQRPTPPTPTSPGSPSEPGQMIEMLTPTLQWSGIPEVDYYAVAVSEYPYGGAHVVYDPQDIRGTSTIVPTGQLRPGTKYRWNMQAHGSGQWSEVSATLYFQTKPQPAAMTVQVVPAAAVSQTPLRIQTTKPPTAVLSPVIGDLEVVHPDGRCSGNKWCFNQHKEYDRQTGVGHCVGGGIGRADDTYAWDINLYPGDLDAGKPVYAVAPGVVCKTYGDGINCGGSCGQILIEHHAQDTPWWSGYLHLRSIQVRPDQAVDAGTILGYVSNVSRDQVPNHLHFAVYQGKNTLGGLASFDPTITPRPSAEPAKAEATRMVKAPEDTTTPQGQTSTSKQTNAAPPADAPAKQQPPAAEKPADGAKPPQLSPKERAEAAKLWERVEKDRKIMNAALIGEVAKRRVVELCRQIIRQFPDSEYALKARKAMADLPQKDRRRFGITDQETGVAAPTEKGK